MDFIQTPIGVLIILALVAITAVSYIPPTFLGNYKRLAERYQTESRPRSVQFPGEHIMVGRMFGGSRILAFRFAEFARFDVAIDDDGLWLVYDGPNPKKAPDCMFIPWSEISFKKDMQRFVSFGLAASEPVEIAVAVELGRAIQRRVATTR